ncbi:Autophagy-related protein [Dirofilaria immitis]
MASMATTTTKLTVMKCHDCNAPFGRNDEFGNYAGSNESLTQSINSQNTKDGEKIERWWWCRDCMATLCRVSTGKIFDNI